MAICTILLLHKAKPSVIHSEIPFNKEKVFFHPLIIYQNQVGVFGVLADIRTLIG